MWATCGPTPYTRLRRARSIEPPATPSTRTSSARMAVAWLATWTYDSAGRPRLMAATLVDVPPTSTMTPSSMRFDRSAPATDAAGPEYSVRGRRAPEAREVGRATVAAHDHHRRC